MSMKNACKNKKQKKKDCGVKVLKCIYHEKLTTKSSKTKVINV